jgi:hypothetical protein
MAPDCAELKTAEYASCGKNSEGLISPQRRFWTVSGTRLGLLTTLTNEISRAHCTLFGFYSLPFKKARPLRPR